jgi:hypothetical protein
MSKIKPQVDATCDLSTVSSAKIIPPFVFSFCLKGRTKILQPVGLGIFPISSDFFSVGITPTKVLSGNSILGFELMLIIVPS